MMDNASHSVDIFRFLVGDPTHVTAMMGNIAQKLAVEDFGTLLLSVRGRAFGEITCSHSLRPGNNWVELYATKGTAAVSYGNPGRPELSYRAGPSWNQVEVDCSKRPHRFPAQIAHFLECVRKKRKPRVTVDDGLKATKIMAAAYRSAAEGKQIRLSL